MQLISISNLDARRMHALALNDNKPIRIVYIALSVITGYVIDFSPVIYYMCNFDCVAKRISVCCEKCVRVDCSTLSRKKEKKE